MFKRKSKYMVREHHYTSLKDHVLKLVDGLTEHKEKLPEELREHLSEEFYLEAIESLDEGKKRLEKHQEKFNMAQASFHQDYETVRKAWKKDIARLKRLLNRKGDRELLKKFGV